jgi:hypothetical protein
MITDHQLLFCLIAALIAVGIVGSWLIDRYLDPRQTRGGQTGFDVKSTSERQP